MEILSAAEGTVHRLGGGGVKCFSSSSVDVRGLSCLELKEL